MRGPSIRRPYCTGVPRALRGRYHCRMRRPKLIVIDPSIAFPEDEGVREVVGDWPGETKVLQPGLTPGDGPKPSDGYDADGIVLMGSRASVHDTFSWIGD